MTARWRLQTPFSKKWLLDLSRGHFFLCSRQAPGRGLLVHDAPPERRSAQRNQHQSGQPRTPSLPARTTKAIAQTQPRPAPAHQPDGACQSEHRHRNSTGNRPAAQGRQKQRRVKQPARHERPTAADGKNPPGARNHRLNTSPHVSPDRLHPCRSAQPHHHHQAPPDDGDVHQTPDWTQGAGALA